MLNSELIDKVLREAMDRLGGEWVLVGGSLLVAQGISSRSTVDIDLVGLSNPTQSDTLALMEIASENALPIETLNQAASYFVLKIPELRSHLEPWITGKRGTLYQPDLYLYVRTKIERLSDTDSKDVLAWIASRRPMTAPAGIKQTTEFLESKIATTVEPEKKIKLVEILSALNS
jgi:hypothetical protein